MARRVDLADLRLDLAAIERADGSLELFDTAVFQDAYGVQVETIGDVKLSEGDTLKTFWTATVH